VSPERVNATRVGSARATFRRPEALLWAVVGVGCLLRVVRYADNRSFWLDESLLGLNLISRSATELRSTLDYIQSAPYGFLLGQRGVIAVLGDSELSLRLVPLLASLASLVVFGLIVRRLLAPVTAVLAAALFAFAEPLIYQGSEAKPYSSDVLACLAIVWLTLRIEDHGSLRAFLRRVVALGVVGIAAVWISYPAAFVLAAAGGALVLRALLTRAAWQLPPLVALGGGWLLAFVVSYATSASAIATVRESVFTASPSVGSHLGETIHLAWFSFSDPGGFYPPLRTIAVLCLVAGLVAFARERLDHLVLVAGPGALAVAATLLSRYPFGGRFVLFLAPLGFIVVARGAEWLWRLAGRKVVVAIVLILALVGPQVYWSARHLGDPPRRQHIRPLLQTLKRDWRPGDTLYVYRNAQFALRWYAECEDCDVRPLPMRLQPAAPGADDGGGMDAALASSPPTVIVGRAPTDDETIARTIRSLMRKPRVWLLFSHAALHQADDLNDEQRWLRAVDRSGARIIESWEESGAALYLVDFSRSR
jgi:hypothetical protein